MSAPLLHSLRQLQTFSLTLGVSLGLALFGCSDGSNLPADAGVVDLRPVPPPPVRKLSMPLSTDPNGLYWDAAAQTLYIADDDNNQILEWTDAGGVSVATKLPAAAAGGPGLGQLVITADGTIFVPRFGGGTAGDVVFVKKDGTMGVVPGLATDRRRIGLTVSADGTLFDSFFVKPGADRIGTVARLDLQSGESDAITTLKKPVGVLAMGGDLYISDQDLGQILKAPIGNPTTNSVLANLPSPDLLAPGPNGSLFTGGLDGGVRQIAASGAVTLFQDGLKQPRGVAFDAAARRLFIANHDGDPTDGTAHTLEIVPVD